MIISKRLFHLPLLAIFAISVFLTTGGCSKSNENNIKTIQAAVAPTVPPYSFEQNGQLVGVDLEIFKGYCESRGYEY